MGKIHLPFRLETGSVSDPTVYDVCRGIQRKKSLLNIDK